MLLLQLEKGTEESGPGPSRLHIQFLEGCHNYIVIFGRDLYCDRLT